MGSLPEHHDVFTSLNVVCANAIAACEAAIEEQKASDRAEAQRSEEEKTVRENMARMVAEWEEKERVEKLEKMEKDKQDIEIAERELAAKKEVLRNAQKGPEDEDEGGSESAAEEHSVSPSVVFYMTLSLL
jgi:hypothetical protein